MPVLGARAARGSAAMALALVLGAAIAPPGVAGGHGGRTWPRRVPLSRCGAGAAPSFERLPLREVVMPARIRVHDGDTFSIGCERIRLLGIDAPEWGRPRAALAARRLAALLALGPVTIVRRGRDVYGRTLADVHVGGWSVAEVLRREGFDTARPPARSPRPGGRRRPLWR